MLPIDSSPQTILEKIEDIKNQKQAYQEVKNNFKQKTDVYDLRVTLINTNAELNLLRDFKNRYNFLVERFQKKQNTKWWQTAKKIKGFLKGKK